jgi:hypothetical protein
VVWLAAPLPLDGFDGGQAQTGALGEGRLAQPGPLAQHSQAGPDQVGRASVRLHAAV